MFGVRRRLVAAALLTTVLLTAGCSGSEDSGGDAAAGQSTDKVTFLTAIGAFGREGYAWVAKEKGFFSKRNIDIDIQPGKGATFNLTQVSSGNAQFSANDLSGVWILQGQGKYPEIRTVAAIQQGTLNSVTVMADSGITSARDLVGKTVAGAAGASPLLLWPAYAKTAGVDPAAVTWRPAEATQLIPLLTQGKVDGVGQFVVASGSVEAVAKGRKAHVLAYSDLLTDLYGNGLVTTQKLAAENPDLVGRFRDALLEGLVYSVEHPDEAGEILNKAVPETRAATAAGELKLMQPYVLSGGKAGVIDPARVARAMAILSGAGVIPQNPPAPDKLVAFDLAPKA
jgi:NitT/TauT family transport system substrate-binding protein